VSTQSLKKRILLSFFMIIAVISLSIVLLGFYIIKADIMDRAQQKVRNNLRAARSVYNAEINRIGDAFTLVSFEDELDKLKQKMNLHYLRSVDRADIEDVRSEIVHAAFEKGQSLGGTRLIHGEELTRLNGGMVQKTRIDIKPTPMAMPRNRMTLDSVMAKEYAVPVCDDDGRISHVVYGGRIINRDNELVDRIRYLVFGDEQYDHQRVGTVTIFQDDIRVATNVMNEDGLRAIGTRVSADVYKEVIEKGNVWNERAFVVNAWYKTAYEPIRNINGQIIGILYVGTLAKPFDDMAKNVTLLFVAIIAGAAALAILLSFILASRISRPLTQLVKAAHKLSGGDLGYSVSTETGVGELDEVAESFNMMSRKLDEREQSLTISNEKLTAANKSYLDLISFVSHELKGILASTVMNAYAVRDGLLGMVNFKQTKALDSITRNLDYLEATVRKFLNLGRIEKGELSVNKTQVNIRKDVFQLSIESLRTIAIRKNLNIANEIDPELAVNADLDLLQVAANNLVGNAIKYGTDGGRILLKSKETADFIEIEVYNDSVPIRNDQKDKLFHKFSRLGNDETRKVKGTGLGLYITRQIVENHGGRIWVEPREKGNSFIFQIERGE